MKSVLLHASEDSGFESRFQAALDHVRRFDGHLTCLQVTPFDAFVMADPFGGVYALPVVMERLREKDDSHRGRIEERLRAEGVNWDWIHHDGAPAQMLVARSGLSDLIVTSLPAKGNDGPLSLTADVAVHARTPVLAVPPTPPAAGGTDVVMVAWNGSQEAAHALRLTLDMLKSASAVHIVTVVEEAPDYPADEACRYLARQGVTSDLHDWPRNDRVLSEALLDAAAKLKAGTIVMGAYGHTRLREAVLGGCTRDMLRSSALPLLLAH